MPSFDLWCFCPIQIKTFRIRFLARNDMGKIGTSKLSKSAFFRGGGGWKGEVGSGDGIFSLFLLYVTEDEDQLAQTYRLVLICPDRIQFSSFYFSCQIFYRLTQTYYTWLNSVGCDFSERN